MTTKITTEKLAKNIFLVCRVLGATLVIIALWMLPPDRFGTYFATLGALYYCIDQISEHLNE